MNATPERIGFVHFAHNKLVNGTLTDKVKAQNLLEKSSAYRLVNEATNPEHTKNRELAREIIEQMYLATFSRTTG